MGRRLERRYMQMEVGDKSVIRVREDARPKRD